MTNSSDTTTGSAGLMAEATLTDEMIADMRKLIGVELRIEHSTNNEEATRLAIAKFVDGIGDTNPLWRDPVHAASSSYGARVAPPSWVIACFAGIQFGWPGLGSFHSGSDMVLHRPVYVGDKISATCTYEGFDGPRQSSFAGQAVVDRFRNCYRNQRDELVAEIRWAVMNYERGTARGRGESSEPSLTLPHQWTTDELAAIEADVLAEEPRGAQPRFWEDVNVGDPLSTVTKGPIGLTDEIAFIAAGGAPIPRLAAHRAALLTYQQHPAWAFRDPSTHALEPIYAVHYNAHAANAMGVEMAYDVGFQRQCWQIHLITEWMGDDGWVKEASAQYRRFVYLSDVVRLGGEVTKKYVDDEGEAVVQVATQALNQRGEDVMPGTATIALPSRDHEANPVVLRSSGRVKLE